MPEHRFFQSRKSFGLKSRKTRKKKQKKCIAHPALKNPGPHPVPGVARGSPLSTSPSGRAGARGGRLRAARAGRRGPSVPASSANVTRCGTGAGGRGPVRKDGLTAGASGGGVGRQRQGWPDPANVSRRLIDKGQRGPAATLRITML